MKRRRSLDEPDPNPCVAGAIALLSEAMYGPTSEVGLAVSDDPIAEAARSLFMASPVKPYAHQLVTAAAELLRRAADPDHAQLPIASVTSVVPQLRQIAARRPMVGALRGVWIVAGKRPGYSCARRGITDELAPELDLAYRRVNDAIDAGLAQKVDGRIRSWAELTEAGLAIAELAGWTGSMPRPSAGARRGSTG